jgi:hypothetical protein
MINKLLKLSSEGSSNFLHWATPRIHWPTYPIMCSQFISTVLQWTSLLGASSVVHADKLQQSLDWGWEVEKRIETAHRKCVMQGVLLSIVPKDKASSCQEKLQLRTSNILFSLPAIVDHIIYYLGFSKYLLNSTVLFVVCFCCISFWDRVSGCLHNKSQTCRMLRLEVCVTMMGLNCPLKDQNTWKGRKF